MTATARAPWGITELQHGRPGGDPAPAGTRMRCAHTSLAADEARGPGLLQLRPRLALAPDAEPDLSGPPCSETFGGSCSKPRFRSQLCPSMPVSVCPTAISKRPLQTPRGAFVLGPGEDTGSCLARSSPANGVLRLLGPRGALSCRRGTDFQPRPSLARAGERRQPPPLRGAQTRVRLQVTGTLPG